MTREDFARLCDRHPKAAMKLFRALAVMVVERLRNSISGQSAAEAPPRRPWW